MSRGTVRLETPQYSTTAEDEEAEVRRKEGGGAGKKVKAVSEQDCRFSAEIVVGETPGDAPDDVADPENVFDNHWLVVVIANPIVLTGDSCEDGGMVIIPSLTTSLLWALFHHRDHVMPYSGEEVWV